MTARAVHRSTLALVSQALLNVVERLAVEFPDAPPPAVYDKVGDARATSARYLPDVAAYSNELERHARVALELEYGRRCALSG